MQSFRESEYHFDYQLIYCADREQRPSEHLTPPLIISNGSRDVQVFRVGAVADGDP